MLNRPKLFNKNTGKHTAGFFVYAIAGVEIASDNDGDNKLVVIVDDGVAITAARVGIVYSPDFYAEAELERRRAER